jgi:uncharacterized protein (DUF1501 family)
MLKVLSERQNRQCDNSTRRDFLKVGALGMGGLMLPDLLRARAAASANGRATRNTSVVWLWLSGGPTHVETFDPKMSAPVEFRSTTGAVKTNVPGIEIGGTLENMAKVADKMAFVRSFAHTTSSHQAGTIFVNTGYLQPPNNANRQMKPGHGAILARYRGANHPATGLPTYVRLGAIGGDGPAWLGSSYAPFEAFGGNARANMETIVTDDRIGDRRSMRQTFDSIEREVDNTGLLQGLDSFEQQAFSLIQGAARQAFDITKENQQTLRLYGINGSGSDRAANTGNNRGGGDDLARKMLLARRLCDAGVGFVTINYGGWDMHGNIANSMKQRSPSLDKAVSAFLQDVHSRGSQDNILLVITGDFGRTPRVNRNAGRDHWGPLSTLALAGGGLKMGQTVGESSSRVEVPKTTPITPLDLMATLFHVLGIPQDLHINDQTGRPIPMNNGGRVIRELV